MDKPNHQCDPLHESAGRRRLELFIQVVIVYSLLTHFLELEFTDTERSVGFWLWSERVVATIFTIEYLARWIVSRSWLYPLRPMAIVDLVAILPFYIGFFVDLRFLRLVRTLRVLRLLRLYRYTTALQNIFNAFNRVRHEFSIVGFAVLTLGWISTVMIFELERHAQPEVFGKLSDSAWYTVVTLTTVGYGDKVPITAGGRVVATLTMLAGLGLFGTFVSLIGSAFVEEIRDALARKTRAAEAALPAELRQMTEQTFDVLAVLQSVETGALDGSGKVGHREAVRLLAIACRLLKTSSPLTANNGGLPGSCEAREARDSCP
jgi:voltage-gated potassium channel